MVKHIALTTYIPVQITLSVRVIHINGTKSLPPPPRHQPPERPKSPVSFSLFKSHRTNGLTIIIEKRSVLSTWETTRTIIFFTCWMVVMAMMLQLQPQPSIDPPIQPIEANKYRAVPPNRDTAMAFQCASCFSVRTPCPRIDCGGSTF